MIKSFRISNFKSFGSLQSARLAPLTLIYGQNSSGKSSIIQSLLLLKQSIDPDYNRTSRLVFRGDLIDLGSYISCVHSHEPKRNLLLGFDIDRHRRSNSSARRGRFMGPTRPFSVDLEFEGVKQLGTKARKLTASKLVREDIRLAPANSKRTFSGALPSLYLSLVADKEFQPKVGIGQAFISDPDSVFRIADSESIDSYANYICARDESSRRNRQAHGKSTSDSRKHLPKLDKSERTINFGEVKTMLEKGRLYQFGLLPALFMLDDKDDFKFSARHNELQVRYGAPTMVINGLVDVFNSLSYLGPLRTPPARHYVISDIPGDTVGSSGEFMPGIITQRNLDKEISIWFERLKIPYRVKTTQLGNEITGQMITINLVDLRSKVEVGPSDVGFGIGQLLPIIVEGLVFDDRVICVEQPEIHLHPRLQAELADFLIDTSTRKDDSNRAGNQWIVETHSEALILRVLRRIRQGKISPDDVSVVYVESTEDGEAKIHDLPISQDGEFIKEWPDGFFEEDFDELFGD